MERSADPKLLGPRPMLQNPWLPLVVLLAAALLASGCNIFDWLQPQAPLGGIVGPM